MTAQLAAIEAEYAAAAAVLQAEDAAVAEALLSANTPSSAAATEQGAASANQSNSISGSRMGGGSGAVGSALRTVHEDRAASPFAHPPTPPQGAGGTPVLSAAEAQAQVHSGAEADAAEHKQPLPAAAQPESAAESAEPPLQQPITDFNTSMDLASTTETQALLASAHHMPSQSTSEFTALPAVPDPPAPADDASPHSPHSQQLSAAPAPLGHNESGASVISAAEPQQHTAAVEAEHTHGADHDQPLLSADSVPSEAAGAGAGASDGAGAITLQGAEAPPPTGPLGPMMQDSISGGAGPSAPTSASAGGSMDQKYGAAAAAGSEVEAGAGASKEVEAEPKYGTQNSGKDVICRVCDAPRPVCVGIYVSLFCTLSFALCLSLPTTGEVAIRPASVHHSHATDRRIQR